MDQLRPDGVTITLIHYTYAAGLGEDYRIACMPNMVEFHQTMYHPNYQRTNDVRAVTCPACIKSAAYKEGQRALTEALGRTRRG